MKFKSLSLVIAVLFMCGSVSAISISVGVSGKGVVNDSTVIAGEPFSVDVFFVNDSIQRAFTIGFKMTSENIKQIVHVVDSGKGLSTKGDIKGHNGWEDKSIWDLNGLFVVETNWDGALPDTIGFGGVCIKQAYNPHEKMKCLSWDVVVPTEGTFAVDSSFWPPSGIWIFAGDYEAVRTPVWGGPRKIKVISKAAASDAKAAEKPKEGKK
ncbi:MAG TPA: hypothetical protein VHP63_06825 [candidate division Zixibacteria bacterium]|nr:hypothetical protein [candidate division Zixibacteria bacterium]